MNSVILTRYFPELTTGQMQRLDALGALYNDWNVKINVISRKDIEHLYEHHVLHSLAIAKFIRFIDGSRVMDVGTGGGFPGIPLAIFFPEVEFHLIDRIGKKIKVAQSIADAIGLENVTTKHGCVEEEKAIFDFVVSRAVITFPELVKLVRKNISKIHRNALPNGLICLKGGNLRKESAPYGKDLITTELKDYFSESYFETKKILYTYL